MEKESRIVKDKEQDNPPERRHMLALKIGGDTVEDLIGLLSHILFEFEAHGPHSFTSGGYGSGGVVVYAENYHVDHDEYFERVEEWIAKRKAAEETDAETDD